MSPEAKKVFEQQNELKRKVRENPNMSGEEFMKAAGGEKGSPKNYKF